MVFELGMLVISSEWLLLILGFIHQKSRSQYHWSSYPFMSNNLKMDRPMTFIEAIQLVSLLTALILSWYQGLSQNSGHEGYFKFLFYWVLQKLFLFNAVLYIQKAVISGHTCFTNISCCYNLFKGSDIRIL